MKRRSQRPSRDALDLLLTSLLVQHGPARFLRRLAKVLERLGDAKQDEELLLAAAKVDKLADRAKDSVT